MLSKARSSLPPVITDSVHKKTQSRCLKYAFKNQTLLHKLACRCIVALVHCQIHAGGEQKDHRRESI